MKMKNNTMNTFYIKLKGEEKGPYTMGQLQSMWDKGDLTSDTFYRDSESSEWILLARNFNQESEAAGVSTVKTPEEIKLKNNSMLWFFILGLTFFAGIIAGNIHIIRGGNVGSKIVSRDSFGFNEMFINVDEITGMPRFSAQSRFPIGCRVLKREGIIESDYELDKQIDASRQDLDKAMDDLKKAMKQQ